MLSCIYCFSIISTEFCLPFYLWPLKTTSSVHPFVVSVRFCHFEEFCNISKLCHLVKLLIFQIIYNCDEKCRSYEASLLICTGNFFALWKVFSYPYSVLPIFSPSIGLFSRNSVDLGCFWQQIHRIPGPFPQMQRSRMELFLFQRKATSLTSQEAEAEQQSEPTSSVWCWLLYVPLWTQLGHIHTGFRYASPIFPREREYESRLTTATSQCQPSLLNYLETFPFFSTGLQYTRIPLIISTACRKFLYNFYLN